MAASSAAVIHRLALTAPARVLALAPSLAPTRDSGRAVHFIDIENLCGTSDVRIYRARLAMRSYHATVGIAVGDQVIIGASHHNAIPAWNAWPGARLLIPRSGPDGADLALREAIRTERIAERFSDVFLGSGDGGFAGDLAYLAEAGSTTHVVTRPGQLSRRLRMAAHHVVTLTPSAHA
ncbi:hypothetical protein [Rhodococcus pyridinivorans]